MKKLILLAIISLAMITVKAQQQGDFVVSGAFSYTSEGVKEKTGNQTNTHKGDREFSFIPGIHYFAADNVAVGINLGYSLLKTPNGNMNNSDELFDITNLFSFRPSVRYYQTISDKFYYIPEFYVGFGFGKYKRELTGSVTIENDLSLFMIGINPIAFEFKPSSCVGIRFQCGNLGYTVTTNKADSNNKLSARNFNLQFNVSANVGFCYYF